MTDRGLKLALVISVALNIFVVGALAGGLIMGARTIQDRPHRDRPAVIDMVRSLDEADRAAAEARLRATALAARADFNTARQARSEAIDLAGGATFDRAAVEAALIRSRESEAAGRQRLEGGLLDLMEGLDQEDRQRLAPGLARRGRDGRPGRRGGHEQDHTAPPGIEVTAPPRKG